jgi:hypothetical protein
MRFVQNYVKKLFILRLLVYNCDKQLIYFLKQVMKYETNTERISV